MSGSTRLPRFFVAHWPESESVSLTGDEAHHLMHVLRIEKGRQVRLFDGVGNECVALVAERGRHEVKLVAETRQPVSRELDLQITIAVSLPKGDRQKVLVEKLTELGVFRMIPLLTKRGVSQPSGAAIERLQKNVIAASRQCERNLLMEIAAPQSLTELLDPAARGESTDCCWFAHPGGESNRFQAEQIGGSVLVAIGPEGGFDDAEVQQFFEAGWKATGLGPAILRVETAAIAATARLAAFHGHRERH